MQSGPLLVDPGGKLGIYKEDFDRQRRSAICLDGSAVRIVMVEGGGLSLLELARVLSSPREAGGLACEVALNLDGGPSTQAMARIGSQELSFVGRWRIQNALVLSRRERARRPPVDLPGEPESRLASILLRRAGECATESRRCRRAGNS